MDGWMDGGFPNGAIRAALLEETRRNVSPTVGRVARR
jgi:hypothetical protein